MKVMFLAADGCPRCDPIRQDQFDSKLGIWVVGAQVLINHEDNGTEIHQQNQGDDVQTTTDGEGCPQHNQEVPCSCGDSSNPTGWHFLPHGGHCISTALGGNRIVGGTGRGAGGGKVARTYH